MSHNRDLSAAAAQIGFHNSNIGIGTDVPTETITLNHANGASIGLEYGGTENGTINVNSAAMYVRAGTGKLLILGANGTESARFDSSGRFLIGRTSTTHGHSLQVQADSGANAIAIQGRSADDQSEITFYENDNSTITAQIQQLVDRSIFRHRVGYMRFDTGGTSEKMRLDANGYLGINNSAPHNQYYNNLVIGDGSASGDKGITIRTQSSNEGVIAFSDADSGAARYAGKIAYNHGTNAMMFFTSNGDERLRITSDGKVGVGVAAPDQMMEITNTGSTGAQIQLRDTSTGTGAGDGVRFGYNGSGAQIWNFENTYTRFATNNVERIRILSNGLVNIGGYLSSVSNCGLHVGRGTGGTAAGESVLAATLGDYSTMVSALLTVKNAGNRGTQGHASGSPLAKFEFNNGTAFEIDKYGRRTLQYQPGCKLTIDTNSQGGGNHAQTGRTILPFNSTGYGYNTGNHYNLTTHTFTAPLNGKYLVILSVNVIGDNIAYIYKNGSIHSAGEFRSNPTGVWEHMEISTVVQCSANDTIQPFSQMTGSGRKFNGGTGGSYWDTFTIYYLG